MAYLSLIRLKGDTDQLLQTSKKIDEVISPIARENGGIFHVVAKTDEGTLIVNLWESKDGSDATTNHPDVRAATDEAQKGMSGPPSFEHYEVDRYETG